jgi:tyrosyl-tRNA synthetase
MSKSKPETCIFIYDAPAEIKQKMARAFCPERTAKFNPVLDICKHIIFREKTIFSIERPVKFGGTVEFQSFHELETAYAQGKLHPQDLKNGVADQLAEILEPVRRYFAGNKEAEECLEIVRKAKVTR